MAITDIQIIDFIGTDKKNNEVVLTISDHLEWKDVLFHLETLQEKLNTYIEFIESGQIAEDYPNSVGKKIRIEIVSKQDYPAEGLEFIIQANPVLYSLGSTLVLKVLK